MREIELDGRRINDESECFVVAEIGHNHQGNLETAKQLFLAAKESGASAVKLQKRTNRKLFTAAMFNKPYDHENSFGATYGEHREKLEFGRREYLELRQLAAELQLTFFATPFDFDSADFLAELGMPIFKIASADVKNIPLLVHVANFQKPLILSTGGATLDDVRRAWDQIMPINPRLAILQCTAAYPCEFSEMNLRVIETYRREFPENVIGLSAHDSGIAMSVAAYVLGARIIEKHFTLNRAMRGTDHAFSLERPGLQKLVRDLRRTRVALGDGIKRPYPSEAGPLEKMGKKLVAAHALPAGHVLTIDDIAIKSPNTGVPPYEIDKFLGRRLRCSLVEDDDLSYEAICE